jgi:hypothetical protein
MQFLKQWVINLVFLGARYIQAPYMAIEVTEFRIFALIWFLEMGWIWIEW